MVCLVPSVKNNGLGDKIAAVSDTSVLGMLIFNSLKSSQSGRKGRARWEVRNLYCH